MLFRRKRLTRDARKEATSFIPLSRIKAMAVVLDCNGKGLEECRETTRQVCKANKIELTILYVDFDGINITAPEDTIYKRDLNLYGYPSIEKSGTFLGKWFDCFICLSESDRFCIEYLAKAADATFKLGIRAIPDDAYDVIVAPPANNLPGSTSQKDLFLAMTGIMKKIR